MVDGSTVVGFTYDCFNRRVTKTVNGVTRRYVWLGDDLAVEADASWNVLASYFYQPGVDQPISRTDGSGTVYYLQDHAGSVSALTAPNGSLIGRYGYTPWGEVAADPGMPAQPLLWAGRELDETGLYYLRGRYYHPGIGRFLSEDPAGLVANLNLYLFALNSPVGASDPFGLDAMRTQDVDDSPDGPVLNDPAMRDWRPAFHKARQNIHDGLKTGTEFAAGFNPITNAGMAMNALGEGDLLGAGLGMAPGLGKLGHTVQDARRLGLAGEAASGITKNTQRIDTVLGGVKYRVPDVLDPGAKVIGDVKNVKQLSYTKQLRDYQAYAVKNGYSCELHAPAGTKFSGPLEEAIKNGDIIHIPLGGR